MSLRVIKCFIAIPLVCWLLVVGGKRLIVLAPELFGGFAVTPITELPARAARVPVLQPDQAHLLYSVEFLLPADGELAVEARFYSGGGMVVLDGSKAGEIEFSRVTLRDDRGAVIPVYGKSGKYASKSRVEGFVHLNYRVTLGAKGRHGNQGNYDARFASFDGRIFLTPLDKSRISRVQVQFKGVDHARNRVIAPWIETAERDTFLVRDFGDSSLLFVSLAKSALAYGPFDAARQYFGSTAAEVYSYDKWSESFRSELRTDSFGVVDYFHKSFGFEIDGPLQIIWTPVAQDGRRVYGGVWVGGLAYEMHPYSRSSQRRNFELLGHRIAHTIDRERPYGVTPEEKDEHFFMEGWASYIELVSVRSITRYSRYDGWEPLYQRYVKLLQENPELDDVLAAETNVGKRGSAVVEFVHYTKAPLAVRLLADEVRRVSGGKMTLESFWSDVYQRYRGTGRPVPLKQELREVTGIDADSFWCRVIASRDILLPEWRYSANGKMVTSSLDQTKKRNAKVCRRMGAIAVAPADCEALLESTLKRRPMLEQFLDELPAELLMQQITAERQTNPALCRIQPAPLPTPRANAAQRCCKPAGATTNGNVMQAVALAPYQYAHAPLSST